MTAKTKERWTDKLAEIRHEVADVFERFSSRFRRNGGSDSNSPATALELRRGPEPVEDNAISLHSYPLWMDHWLDQPLSILDGFTSFPRLNLEDRGDEVVVHAEMPGFEKDDIRVEVTGDRLRIWSERRHEREEKRGAALYREFSQGSFARSIYLPADVETGKARAEYRNGILRVTLPKTEAARSQRRQIKVA